MARRLFRGKPFSENGWPYVDQGSCTWVVVPGTNPHVTLQIQNGEPLVIMRAFAADFNAYVEPLRDPISACWTPDNKVATSNHPGGTAMDLNWDFHGAGGARNKGFNAAQVATLRELLDFYEKNIYWGNDWDSFVDPMHFQMGYYTYDQKADRPEPKLGNFIARKIRADGFSTFRRGSGGVPPTPPPSNAADVLSRAAGISIAKAIAVVDQVSFALVKANCTNPRRIAAALAQWVVESGHFVYTEEIADGPETQERWKYKGRTWVQLTWLENYRGFSQWCLSLGLVPTPDYFVVRPRELAEQKWAALGPAYWWAIKYPRINEYADRGDIDNVSKWVNAPAWVDNPNKHANGEQARRDAYNKALALGDQLLVLIKNTPGDDDMIPPDEWRAFYKAYMEDVPSLSPLRRLGEGNVGPLHKIIRFMDGSIHVSIVKLLAGLGQPDAIRDLQALANADLSKYPDRAGDKELANNILADLDDDAQAVVTQAARELQILPLTSEPEVLPAVRETAPTQGNTPEDLLDTLGRLKVFDAAYRQKFTELTGSEE